MLLLFTAIKQGAKIPIIQVVSRQLLNTDSM